MIIYKNKTFKDLIDFLNKNDLLFRILDQGRVGNNLVYSDESIQATLNKCNFEDLDYFQIDYKKQNQKMTVIIEMLAFCESAEFVFRDNTGTIEEVINVNGQQA